MEKDCWTMPQNDIDDALSQVRLMQDLVATKRRFQGYSGFARVLSGAVALLATIVMASSHVDDTPIAHLIGWGVVLFLGIVFNYAALGYWFLFNKHVRRNPIMLKPAVDALPALAVGATLSLALILREHYDLLFGAWMALYGLAQVAYRQSLPSGIYGVGLGYILCGMYCLISPYVTFTNPWPMGIVFLAGEWTGGIILYVTKQRHTAHHTSPQPEMQHDSR